LQELYLELALGHRLDPKLHDIRFVEDDWESPTLGAWGLGWECWCDGMEVSQFTYFQQVAGFECAPVAGELTYGLERLAMYVQGVENVYDLNFNGREGDEKVTYGDVFLQAEQEYSRHNFEYADTAMLFEQFADGRDRLPQISRRGLAGRRGEKHLMALPAYDQCIKASHAFNLLDARGVISVTERQSYILRVRELAKACGAAWLNTEAGPRASHLIVESFAAMPDLLLNCSPKKFPPACRRRRPTTCASGDRCAGRAEGLVYEGAKAFVDAAPPCAAPCTACR
jgi:glycyl-tRNA synthetase alpha chain